MAIKGKGKLDQQTATYILLVPILLLYVLAMVGCISNSPGIADLFLFKVQNGKGAAAANPTASELRVGYFGMCAGAKADIVCLPSTGMTAEKLIARFNEESTKASAGPGDSVSLLPVALRLQSKTFLCVLLIAAILLCSGLLFLALLRRDIKKQAGGTGKSHEQRWRHISLALLWVSAALATLSAAATTQAISSMEVLTKELPTSAVSVTAGVTLQALQWIVAALSALFSLAISVLIKSGTGKTPHKMGLPGMGAAASMPMGPPKAPYPTRPPGAGTAAPMTTGPPKVVLP